jgi:hypothetical protein
LVFDRYDLHGGEFFSKNLSRMGKKSFKWHQFLEICDQIVEIFLQNLHLQFTTNFPSVHRPPTRSNVFTFRMKLQWKNWEWISCFFFLLVAQTPNRISHNYRAISGFHALNLTNN